MAIVNVAALESNKNFKISFDGGNLSSDGGLLLMKEFMHKFGIPKLLKEKFHTTDKSIIRKHRDSDNLLQIIYQILGAYFTDDTAAALKNDPVFTSVLEKDTLASQPTLSRFYNRLDEKTIGQLDEINRVILKRSYSICKPEHILLDIDTTLLDGYGKQEGVCFNYHYQANGYHPFICFDSMTGDLIGTQLRGGSDYCCKNVCDFLEPILNEYLNEYPDTAMFLRGDSGFATDELYSLCETHGTSYAIRLKENGVLRKLASEIESDLEDLTTENMVDYAVVYGEFLYKAKSWDYPRRVVCKIEKPAGQMLHLHTFVVTNMESDPRELIAFYCKRGNMENMIKECKNGFDFGAISSSTMLVNANRLKIHALAYNIFNIFRRLVLPVIMRKDRIDTIRLKLFKTAVRIVYKARYLYFKLCSSCPFKDTFYEILRNITLLTPLLE